MVDESESYCAGFGAAMEPWGGFGLFQDEKIGSF